MGKNIDGALTYIFIYIKSSLFSASVLVRRKVVLLCVVHSNGNAFAFGQRGGCRGLVADDSLDSASTRYPPLTSDPRSKSGAERRSHIESARARERAERDHFTRNIYPPETTVVIS